MIIHEERSQCTRLRLASIGLLAFVVFHLHVALKSVSGVRTVQDRVTLSESIRQTHETSHVPNCTTANTPEPHSVVKSGKSNNGTDEDASTHVNMIALPAQRPLCTRNQIRHGSWLPVDLERPPYVSYTKHLRCFPLDHYKQKPFKYWDWQPIDTSCQLSPWESSDLCQLLPFATVSIIGDSLSWEMFSSLLQLLGARVYQKSQHESKSKNENHVMMACNGRTKFVWRNDARLNKVQDSIEKDFPTVLILNRGPHYENDTVLMSDLEETFIEVADWLEACERRNMKCHFFWRTSVPGHPGCENFSEPVNDIEEMEAMISNFSLYNNRSIDYHWYDFQHQNMLILAALQKTGLPHEVIDGYELNVLRPDGHRSHQDDCLHNCYPGKMDVYNQLLLHYVKMQRSREDAEDLVKRFEEYPLRVQGVGAKLAKA